MSIKETTITVDTDPLPEKKWPDWFRCLIRTIERTVPSYTESPRPATALLWLDDKGRIHMFADEIKDQEHLAMLEYICASHPECQGVGYVMYTDGYVRMKDNEPVVSPTVVVLLELPRGEYFGYAPIPEHSPWPEHAWNLRYCSASNPQLKRLRGKRGVHNDVLWKLTHDAE